MDPKMMEMMKAMKATMQTMMDQMGQMEAMMGGGEAPAGEEMPMPEEGKASAWNQVKKDRMGM